MPYVPTHEQNLKFATRLVRFGGVFAVMIGLWIMVNALLSLYAPHSNLIDTAAVEGRGEICFQIFLSVVPIAVGVWFAVRPENFAKRVVG